MIAPRIKYNAIDNIDVIDNIKMTSPIGKGVFLMPIPNEAKKLKGDNKSILM